jgi:hypothetical protein
VRQLLQPLRGQSKHCRGATRRRPHLLESEKVLVHHGFQRLRVSERWYPTDTETRRRLHHIRIGFVQHPTKTITQSLCVDTVGTRHEDQQRSVVSNKDQRLNDGLDWGSDRIRSFLGCVCAVGVLDNGQIKMKGLRAKRSTPLATGALSGFCRILVDKPVIRQFMGENFHGIIKCHQLQ